MCCFSSQSSADSYDLLEGSTADLLNARLAGEIVSLVLIRYQGRDWHGHIRIQQDLAEFFSVCLVCEVDPNMTVDVSVHVMRTSSCVTLSLFSPYWIINQTSRVLQYRAESVSLKHPADFRDIVLFSFRKTKVFSKSKVRNPQSSRQTWSHWKHSTSRVLEADMMSEFKAGKHPGHVLAPHAQPDCSFLFAFVFQLQLCISNSSWSDAFSLDTVGSYGCVQCPASNMDYLVGSFNDTPEVSHPSLKTFCRPERCCVCWCRWESASG